MPNTYKISLQVEKQHPFVAHPLLRKDGSKVSWQEENYMALVKAMASNPAGIFNIDESGYIYKDPDTGNSYWIKLQE